MVIRLRSKNLTIRCKGTPFLSLFHSQILTFYLPASGWRERRSGRSVIHHFKYAASQQGLHFLKVKYTPDLQYDYRSENHFNKENLKLSGW
jgi:hypothetical protein